MATTASAGAPIAFPVAEGPIRIAGEPYLTGKLTTLTPGSRAFLGLGIGTSPADAELVQGNVLPLDVPDAGHRQGHEGRPARPSRSTSRRARRSTSSPARSATPSSG